MEMFQYNRFWPECEIGTVIEISRQVIREELHVFAWEANSTVWEGFIDNPIEPVQYIFRVKSLKTNELDK